MRKHHGLVNWFGFQLRPGILKTVFVLISVLDLSFDPFLISDHLEFLFIAKERLFLNFSDRLLWWLLVRFTSAPVSFTQVALPQITPLEWTRLRRSFIFH